MPKKLRSARPSQRKLEEIAIRDAANNLIIAGYFKDKSSKPQSITLFDQAINKKEHVKINTPARSRISEMTSIMESDATKRFAVYWQKGMKVKNKNGRVIIKVDPGKSISEQRLRLLSHTLFHIYLLMKSGRSLPAKSMAPLIELGLSRLTGTKEETTEPNGCTLSPDGYWKECCDKHDVCYDIGGNEDDRWNCDEGLYQCMLDLGVPWIIAETYYRAVRLFGASHFNYHD